MKRRNIGFIVSCAGIIAIWITAHTDIVLSKGFLGAYNGLSTYYFRKNDALRENNTREKSQELDRSLNATMILILTYHRSGSTLTGDMFNNNPAAMYVFEPLKSVEILKESGKPLQFLDSRKKYLKTEDDIGNISLNTLTDIFSCRFENLDVAALSQHHLTQSFTTNKFVQCVRSSAAINHTHIMACIKPFRESCLDRKVRSIKTIRLSMRKAEIMMKELPNLKIIHLIRDPRGMLRSRVAIGAFRWSTIAKESKAACTEILNDILDSAHLYNMSPDRIMTILYENIAEAPLEALKKIYKFSNLPMDPSSVQWLINATMSGTEVKCNYCTTKANSTATAYSWRHKLQFKLVKIIDENCKMLYEKLGYRSIDLEKNLSNMLYPSRV